MGVNYYNENDPKAAAWLLELIRAGEISTGEVDERSIVEVKAHELKGYAQCHFFAGIGGWSLALRLAGWPDDEPVWTGSCPCQPFSQAGQQRGEADERHLWPVLKELIRHGQPAIAFGEQVASKLGREWLAGVRTDLEGMGYEVGGADLCAASVGAPHRRQRLFWVAHSKHAQRWAFNLHREHVVNGRDEGRSETYGQSGARGEVRGLANTNGGEPGHGELQPGGRLVQQPEDEAARGLADVQREGPQKRGEHQGTDELPPAVGSGAVGGQAAWSAFDILPCLDGKARRVESGTFPLAHGVPRWVVPSGHVSVQEAQATGEARVARLRGYGNAIVPQLAAEFIKASVEAIAT